MHVRSAPVTHREGGEKADPQATKALGYVVWAVDTPWQPASTHIHERVVYFIRCHDDSQVLRPGEYVEFVNHAPAAT